MTTEYCCKVARVAEKYGVPDAVPSELTLSDALLARWQGRDGYREHGYRTLTDWFNRQLFERAAERADRRVSDPQLTAEYEVLTGEDELQKLDLQDELAAAGIDAEQLLADMVSWSSMRGHLTDCLGGEKTREATTDWERNSIEISRSQARGKIEEAVAALGSKGEIAGAEEAAVSIDVHLHCDRCDTAVPLVVALERGHVCEIHHAVDS
ncbi:MAG: rod-determining factor RdfA [Halodesulfurarchaeum sp.]